MNIEIIESQCAFSLEEAVKLLDEIVTGANDACDNPSPFHTGTIAGLITFNEQIEVVVKFIGRLDQCTKSEFLERYKIIKT